jgi:hypothetical protein
MQLVTTSQDISANGLWAKLSFESLQRRSKFCFRHRVQDAAFVTESKRSLIRIALVNIQNQLTLAQQPSTGQ